jgi:hypothetical protein
MFFLYQFKLTDGRIVVTRGRNVKEAAKYIKLCHHRAVEQFDYCSIDAAFLYSKNHAYDWLNNSPLWLDPDRPLVPRDRNFGNRFFHLMRQTANSKKGVDFDGGYDTM